MEIYLGLGANIGDRLKNIMSAVAFLEETLGCRCSRMSSILETEPWGFESENKFLNAVAVFESDISPTELLAVCKDTEKRMGRDLSVLFDDAGKRIYRSRPIDIDILFHGEHHVSEQDLVIPHPAIRERDFVLVPLSEVVSDNIRKAFPLVFA